MPGVYREHYSGLMHSTKIQYPYLACTILCSVRPLSGEALGPRATVSVSRQLTAVGGFYPPTSCFFPFLFLLGDILMFDRRIITVGLCCHRHFSSVASVWHSSELSTMWKPASLSRHAEWQARLTMMHM